MGEGEHGEGRARVTQEGESVGTMLEGRGDIAHIWRQGDDAGG